MQLLDTPAVNCELHESGLLLVTDKTGAFHANMLVGPVGSLSGDSTRTQMFLPKFEVRDLPFRQQVFFWLTRRPVSLGYASSTAYGGDSLIHIGAPAVIHFDTSTGQERVAQFHVNEDGRLAGVAFQFNEPSAETVEEKAYSLIGFVLSHIAFEQRVPLQFDRVEVFDLTTDPFKYYVTVNKPFVQVNWEFTTGEFAPPALTRSRPWRRALAFYRESLLLTHLPMYRFLALYKGIEDLRATKAELGKSARKNGGKIEFPKAFLPKDQHFSSLFHALSGQPLHKGEQALQADYRNLVAHNSLSTGEFLTSDLRAGLVAYNNRCTLADVVFRLTANTIRTAATALPGDA